MNPSPEHPKIGSSLVKSGSIGNLFFPTLQVLSANHGFLTANIGAQPPWKGTGFNVIRFAGVCGTRAGVGAIYWPRAGRLTEQLDS